MPRMIPIKQLQGFQKLHDGVPIGKLSCFYGPPEGAKSTICGKLAVECAMALDGNVLVFDTENSADSYEAWVEAWEETFEVDINFIEMAVEVDSNNQKTKRKYEVGWDILAGEEDKDLMNIFVLSCPDIRDILIAHGRGVEVAFSDNAESGKTKLIPQGDAWVRQTEEAPFYKFCKAHNIKAIVYDSITNPLNENTDSQENLPVRAKMTQIWLNMVQRCAAKLQLPIFCIFHESKNDAGAFSKGLKMQGGKAVGYTAKYVTYMLKEMEKYILPGHATRPDKTIISHPDARAAWVSRNPRNKSWKEVVYFELSDASINDLDAGSSKSSKKTTTRKTTRKVTKTPKED